VSAIGFRNRFSGSHPTGAATPGPRGRRTHAHRIAELERGFLDLQQQLDDKTQQFLQLVQEIEDRKVVEHQLRQQLEEYKREHGTMRTVADQFLGAMAHVNRNTGQRHEAGVGPEVVQSQQRSPIEDDVGPEDVQTKQGAETSPMENGVHPEQRPAGTSQTEDDTRGAEDAVIHTDIVSSSNAAQPDAAQAQDISPTKEGSCGAGEMVVDDNNNGSLVALNPTTTSEVIMGEKPMPIPQSSVGTGEQRQEEGAMPGIGTSESIQPERPCQGIPPADESGTANERTVGGVEALTHLLPDQSGELFHPLGRWFAYPLYS
jgi:hypothetical protein